MFILYIHKPYNLVSTVNDRVSAAALIPNRHVARIFRVCVCACVCGGGWGVRVSREGANL